jgi:hypothetical protein
VINAYRLEDGGFAGTLRLEGGVPFSVTELWAVSFGNGASAGSTDMLFFTAGLEKIRTACSDRSPLSRRLHPGATLVGIDRGRQALALYFLSVASVI